MASQHKANVQPITVRTALAGITKSWSLCQSTTFAISLFLMNISRCSIDVDHSNQEVSEINQCLKFQ